MTDAKLKPAPAPGHGLTPRIIDRVYDDLVAGRDPGTLVGLFEVKAVEHGEKITANGTVRHVKFEVVKAEPYTDSHDADQARWALKEAWDKRHGGSQLPLDYDQRNDDEKRRHILSLVDEWATEQGLTPADVAERWRTQWGITGDEPANDGAFAHPDINKAAVHHVEEFAYMVGVLADAPEAAADDVAGTPDDNGQPELGDTADDSDPA